MKVAFKLLKILKRAVFPEDITCSVCGAELTADTRYHFCARCTAEMPYVGEERCLLCGTPLKNEAEYCINCMNKERLFEICRSPLIYKGIGKKLVEDLKFRNRRYIVADLGALMADEYLKNKLEYDVVCYVPMTKNEVKRRGFNQSELLAKEVADRLKLEFSDALIKSRETGAQKELSAKDRAENLKNAFTVLNKEQIKGKRVLLVDDVFTTGATANEVARVLKRSYARSIGVLTACITESKIYSEKCEENI